MAAIGAGNFFATPNPNIKLKGPGARWHWGKVLYENYWLSTGLMHQFYRTLMRVAARANGLDVRP